MPVETYRAEQGTWIKKNSADASGYLVSIFPVPGTLRSICALTYPHDDSRPISPFPSMRRPEFRKIEYFDQGHLATKSRNCDSDKNI